jgi:hypothetical protein
VQESLTLGVAFQDFGSDYRAKETYGDIVDEGVIRLPRYFRVGFSYTVTQRGHGENDGNSLSLVLTAEYRNLLNAGDGDNRDFWGFGVETEFFELVSARAGGYVQPFTSVYGARGKLAFRYGFGLNLALPRIGVHIPFGINLYYAGIPPQLFGEYFDTQRSWDVEVCYMLAHQGESPGDEE